MKRIVRNLDTQDILDRNTRADAVKVREVSRVLEKLRHMGVQGGSYRLSRPQARQFLTETPGDERIAARVRGRS